MSSARVRGCNERQVLDKLIQPFFTFRTRTLRVRCSINTRLCRSLRIAHVLYYYIILLHVPSWGLGAALGAELLAETLVKLFERLVEICLTGVWGSLAEAWDFFQFKLL